MQFANKAKTISIQQITSIIFKINSDWRWEKWLGQSISMKPLEQYFSILAALSCMALKSQKSDCGTVKVKIHIS